MSAFYDYQQAVLGSLGKAPGLSPDHVDDETVQLLDSLVKSQIVPRLVRAHERPPVPQVAAEEVDGDLVEELACRLAGNETAQAVALVEQQVAAGMAPKSAATGLFGPVAQRLGEFWLEDRCSFYDVTLGLNRLQYFMRERFAAHDEFAEAPERALPVVLTGAPGEQHLFGLSIVEEFFRDAGFRVHARIGSPIEVVVDEVRTVQCAFVAFSCSCNSLLEGLTSAIRRVRGASRNRDLKVLVGGGAFLNDETLWSTVGADCFAADAGDAVDLVSRLTPTSRIAGPA